VNLTAANSAGSDDEIKPGYITVSGGEPVADFTAAPLAGARPLTVTFTDLSTNAPDSWEWTFGDGDSTNATDQNPVHSYAAAGTYTVTLNTTNALGTGSMTKTDYITVTPQCDLTISGTVAPVPLTGVFVNEPNTIKVNSIKNNGPDTVTNISLALFVSDVSGGTVPVATAVIESLASGGTNTTTLIDPTVRTVPGGSVTYTVIVDPDNLIAETSETNNNKAATRTVYYNGYKGKRYTDGSDFTTKALYSGRYGLVYSPGDSSYMGVTGTWTFNYTAADLPVPAGATVTAARLYQPYRYNMYPGGVNWTITINGNNITDMQDAAYVDRPYYTPDYPAGLYVYNVTDLFNTSGNTITITKPSPFTTSMFGPYLVVVYYDPSTSVKKIWINDEFDYLYSSVISRGVSTEEATAYAIFAGADTADLESAKVIAVCPLADNATAPASTFIFNSQLYPATLGSGYLSSPSVAFTEYDVTGELTGGTNTALLQSNTSGAGGGDELMLANTILIAEKTWTAEPERDLIVTAVSPNPGAGDLMFANEPNSVSVTVKNNGTAAADASTVALDDNGTVFSAAVGALDAGASSTVTVTDTVLHTGGMNATLVATADSENVIAESSETNNLLSVETPAYNNGYKGMRYTNGSDFATQVSYDGRYGIAWSHGDTTYHSAGWNEFSGQWTSSDLPVPSGATVVSARLYQPWTWNYESADPAFTMTFNGDTVTRVAEFADQKGWGSWDLPNGVYVYDVTSRFAPAGNTITVTPETAHNYALWGAYMIVVYQDNNQPVRQIRVNDGFDNIYAGSAYSVNSSEGTAYAGFSGISTDGVTSAHATAIMAAAADNDKSRFLFNGNGYTGFWPDYQTTPQIGFSTYDVTSALEAGANEAGMQSYDTGSDGDNMYALNAILVTEASDAAPVAAFSGTPLSGDAPLTVVFTDASTGAITSWHWDFGDGDTTNATVQSPVHTYAANGTYAVNLTVTGPGGSGSEVKPAYVMVGSGILPLPGLTNPPRDLDSDGLYEDTNGNGRKDVGDVVVFLDNINWIKANEPLAAFDFNGNDRIDIGDIIVLFDMTG
jgi:PKD repeat protein